MTQKIEPLTQEENLDMLQCFHTAFSNEGNHNTPVARVIAGKRYIELKVRYDATFGKIRSEPFAEVESEPELPPLSFVYLDKLICTYMLTGGREKEYQQIFNPNLIKEMLNVCRKVCRNVQSEASNSVVKKYLKLYMKEHHEYSE